MAKYRKRPVVIEARQLVGTDAEAMQVCDWVRENGYPWLLGDALDPSTLAPVGGRPGDPGIYLDPASGGVVIRTLEGDMLASYGDYVIKGVQGEFYPCKPDIFEATYEPVG